MAAHPFFIVVAIVLLQAIFVVAGKQSYYANAIVCKVVRADAHSRKRVRGPFFFCEGADRTYYLQVDPDSKLFQLQGKAPKNKLYIAFPPVNVSVIDGVPTVPIPQGDSVEFVPRKKAKKVLGDERRRLLQKHQPMQQQRLEQHHLRFLRPAKGIATVLIVRVSALNASPILDADQALLELTKASDQISDCSDYVFRLTPVGVIDVTVGRNISDLSYVAMYFAAQRETNLYFGIDALTSPVPLLGINHIIYHIPIGLRDDADQYGLSFAGQGDTWMLLQHWMFQASTLLHELGHNYDLFHSRETLSSNPDGDNTEDPGYGDDTGLMGDTFFPGTDGKLKIPDGALQRCYNGANNWELLWYRSSTLDLSKVITTVGDYITIPLVIFLNKEAIQNGMVGTIKLLDYFITYNENIGPNSETVELKNKTLVMQAQRDGGTILYAVLDTPGTGSDIEYTFPNTNIRTEICGSHPNSMHVLVGINVTCADLPTYCFNDGGDETIIAFNETSVVRKKCSDLTPSDCAVSNAALNDGTPPVWEVCATECRKQSKC